MPAIQGFQRLLAAQFSIAKAAPALANALNGRTADADRYLRMMLWPETWDTPIHRALLTELAALLREVGDAADDALKAFIGPKTARKGKGRSRRISSKDYPGRFLSNALQRNAAQAGGHLQGLL